MRGSGGPARVVGIACWGAAGAACGSCACLLPASSHRPYAWHPLQGMCRSNKPSSLSSQTVIECLKMACTGELPPNTRSGQSFIHDPKARKLLGG